MKQYRDLRKDNFSYFLYIYQTLDAAENLLDDLDFFNTLYFDNSLFEPYAVTPVFRIHNHAAISSAFETSGKDIFLTFSLLIITDKHPITVFFKYD